MPVLLIEVHLLERLWHGAIDWPPSPFRLFQALVAGAYGGRWAGENDETKSRWAEALRWLERQNPPAITFPPRSRVRQVTSFVPNNDLDSVGGDPNRVSEVRAEKVLVPWRIENGDSFLYAWTFEDGDEHARLICALAERLYRFGRGLDGAWALADVLSAADAEELLHRRGSVSRPCGQSHPGLRCPAAGSLDSLIRRHEASAIRFKWDPKSRKFLFRQAPKPTYATIAYDLPGTRLWFEIRNSADLDRFLPVSAINVVPLVEEVRDRAARRLVEAMPECLPQMERFLTGRSAGSDDVDRRIRIVALPSIGHAQTSPAIRRVGVLIPPNCPVPVRDVEWAFSGLAVFGSAANTIEHAPGVLVQSEPPAMASHYGVDRSAARWRTVTPIALPRPIRRVRTGSQRSESETRAALAVVQACRHAGVIARPIEIRVQIEPFLLRGELAHAYQSERFSGRLLHAEITFERSVRGPLLVGDGRFLGLGLMQPVFDRGSGLHVFSINGSRMLTVQDAHPVLRALRRAVLARAQDVIGHDRPLPVFFHGHEADGAPARGGQHAHLFFAAYSSGGGTQVNRVAVIAPDFCDRTSQTRRYWETLARAVEDMQFLVCGRTGKFRIAAVSERGDEIFELSRFWRSVTPYRTTRHPKGALSLSSFIESDVKAECARRAIPTPLSVQVSDIQSGPRESLSATLTLTFKGPVRGPLLLGRGSHFGEGLFTVALSS